MIIDAPSAHPAETSASTASTNDTASPQSAPSTNPSASVASTTGNRKRKRTYERDSGRTSKKQKKKQQRKKKEKHRTNTEESDAEESNDDDDDDDEEGFEEMPSDVDTDSDADEDAPLSLMTRTTARQLAKDAVTDLAKDAVTDSSRRVSSDQSITQGPQDLDLPKTLPSAGVTDPSLQSTNALLPDKRADQSPHSTVQASSAVLEPCQPDCPAAVNIATESSAVDSSPIDGFDQWTSLLSPPPDSATELSDLQIGPPSPIPTSPTSTQLHISPAPEILPSPAWPTWFANAYETLKNKNLGLIFLALLPLYVELESCTNFDIGGTTTGFRKGNRPDEVSWWIGRGREREPTIKNVDVFDKRWWSWWKGLQPPSRQVAAVEGLLSGEHRLVEVEEDWDVLRKHGQNGFLTVLSTLAWWGGSINGRPVENFASWLVAVNEVHWVLLRLLESRYAVIIRSLYRYMSLFYF